MEAKDILSLIGFEAEEGAEIQLDAVRDHFNNSFLAVGELNDKHPAIEKMINSSVGQRFGSLQTTLISQAKENGLDLKHSDFKDKKIEEIIPSIFGGFKEKMESVKKPDSKLAEELDRWKNEASTYQSTVEQLQTQLSEKDTQFENEKRTWLVDHAENEAWGSINFSPNANNLMKRGFKSAIKEKYDFVTDDSKQVWPVYKDGDKKGSRVQNPSNLTKMMTMGELLQFEAKSNGLLAEPNEGKPGAKPNGAQAQRQAPTRDVNSRVKTNPRFGGGVVA